GLRALIRRATTELAVTDQRVIFKTGLVARHTLEMNRGKVESVTVDQSIPGRMFGYGTIIVRGTGSTLEPIRNIADPLTFRSQIPTACPRGGPSGRPRSPQVTRGPRRPFLRAPAAIRRSRTSRG